MDVSPLDRVIQFERRLAETIAWCASRDWQSDPAQGLRSALLRPCEQATLEQTFPDYNEFFGTTPQQRQQIVEQLAQKRSELLQAHDIMPIMPGRPIEGGILLAFAPDSTLSDGAAAFSSKGFFDLDNVPAWDTWICYVHEEAVVGPQRYQFGPYLLSWIPEALFGAAADGIDVNPEYCICWAKDLDGPFIRQLREAGLLD